MPKAITYNSFDFQDSNFRTKDIMYRNLPNKVIDLELKARRDGFRLINTYYDMKDIVISGTLTRDTEANLKTSLDSMKEALGVNTANLDIGDGDGTIRYTASVASIDIPEEHYHITSVPYKITFRCQPLGKAITPITDTKTITEVSSSPYMNTFDPTGSVGPLPVLKWVCVGPPTSAITQIVFNNISTGDFITVANLALDASVDYLEIDVDSMTVKVSHDGGAATEVDFTGVFPKFVAGSNSYSVTITGGGATWILTQTITYYSLYL